MSKTLGSILIVAAAIAVNVIPGVGQFISANLVAIGLSTATATAITTAIVSTVTAAGLASAANLLGLGPGGVKPETTDQPIKTSRPPRVSAYGRSRLYWAYCLYETAPDGTAVDVGAVHDGPASNFAYYLSDDAVTLTGNAVDEGTDGRYRDDAVSIYTTSGANPGTAIGAITSLLPGIWTSSHRGDGVVIMALTAKSVKVKRFQETYPSGQVPIPSLVADWQLCPDPSAEDPTDESEWTHTHNPVRHLLHYKLVREGVDYATKIAPAIQSWIDAAADCDDTSPLAAGGTEARYRGCVVHKHTDQHKDVIGAILATFDGWMSPRPDGAFQLYSGRYYEPTVSIGPDEIVSYSWDGVGIDDNEAVNEIIVSYVSSEHDWNTVEGEAWRDEADISARGQVLSQPLDVQVPSFPQARRLAKRKMARIMAPARGTVTTKVAGRAVRGERYINLTIEEAGTTFYEGPAEIIALSRNIAPGGVTFSWVAADPDIDDWNAAVEEGNSAAQGDRVPPSALIAPEITDVEVSFGAESGGGAPGAFLIVTVDSPDREDLIWFIRTREEGATVWGEREYTDIASGASIELVSEFVPTNTSVEVEVAYQVGDGRISAWSATETVSTAVPVLFNPANLFFAGDEGCWFDISDLSSMFQDTAATIPAAVNSAVARINDKSGNGNHALQATGANQPILKLDGDGNHYLEFDGTNDSISAGFACPQPWTRISAIRQISWETDGRIFGNPTATFTALLAQVTSTPTIDIYDGTSHVAANSDLAVGDNGVVSEFHSGASSSLTVDNGTPATGNPGTTAADGLRIAADQAGIFGNIRVYGVLMIGRALSGDETTALRQHMADKANVTL